MPLTGLSTGQQYTATYSKAVADAVNEADRKAAAAAETAEQALGAVGGAVEAAGQSASAAQASALAAEQALAAAVQVQDGASAHQVAVANGFVGTEVEWLDSLKADGGEPVDLSDYLTSEVAAQTYATPTQVDAAVAKLVDAAPAALDTFKEVAAYIAGDQTAAAAMLATQQQQGLDLAGKVDKVVGKGLSTADYTNEDKAKLAALPGAVYSTQQADDKFALKGEAGDTPALVLCRVFAGAGGNSQQTALTGSDFNTVPFGSVDIDTHAGWNAATFQYEAKESGYYNITTKLRLPDGAGGGTGRGYAQGASITNQDGPQILWLQTNTNRNGSFNEWTVYLTAGQHVRCLYFLDAFTVTNFSGEMIIRRIAA